MSLRTLYIISLLIVRLSGQDESPVEKFHRQLDRAENEYRQELADQLKDATRVELHWVKFPREWKDWRPIQSTEFRLERLEIDPFAKPSANWSSNPPADPPVHGSIKKLELEQGVREELLRILSRDLARQPVTQFACGHNPTYALKIWKGDQVIFLQSFGGSCRNFSFHYPDLIGRPGRRHLIAMSDKLHELLPELLPIPQEEHGKHAADGLIEDSTTRKPEQVSPPSTDALSPR